MAQAQSVKQVVGALVGDPVPVTGTQWAQSQLLAHAAGEELVLGVLENGPDATDELRSAPPRRVPTQTPPSRASAATSL